MKYSDVVKDMAVGAAAGAAATIPMSWAMELMHRMLPRRERHPLPPREITDRITGAMGMRHHFSDEQQLWLALASHLGYGAGVGAIYGAVTRKLPLPPIAKGTVFGLVVWAASYLGVLPALGIMRSATRHPLRRTAVMVIAHLVFGSALAVFTDVNEQRHDREHLEFLGGKQSTKRRERQYA